MNDSTELNDNIKTAIFQSLMIDNSGLKSNSLSDWQRCCPQLVAVIITHLSDQTSKQTSVTEECVEYEKTAGN